MPEPRQIGPFEILEPLGAGGMGEVFKARDRRLNRFVALKFLPETATPAARERFQREAMAIAALNHPNICTLYEVGDEGGRPYLVLELLEGETLRSRLRRAGAAPAEQVLDWALETADALDAAHRKGVLHRDLKPENLWVTSNGHIKVLDFGLARLETGDAAEAATLNPDQILTSPGQTMGTIPYMSPEQARGEALDARSDLFSFGSVLYEMAAGRPAFPGRSAAEISAAILKEQPARLSSLRSETPPMLEQVTGRCLEKDPDLRYQSAADLRSDLKRCKRESGSAAHASFSTSSTAAVLAPAAPARRGWLWPAAAALIVLAAGLAYWRLLPHAAGPMVLQFRQLTFSGHVVDAVISPDGKFLAHVDAGPQGVSLHLLSTVNGSDVAIATPGPGCCQSPSFSPDGGSVDFLQNKALYSVPVLGGTVATIASRACSGAGFSPDGSQIAYIAPILQAQGASFRLMLARPDGSAAHVLHQSSPASGGYLSQCWIGAQGVPSHAPAWSPDGRWIALFESPTSGDSHVLLVSPRDGSTRTLRAGLKAVNVADLSWLPDGSGLVFTDTIPSTAASQAWEITYPGGKLQQITSDLQGYTAASVSRDGQLVLVHGVPQASIWAQARTGGDFQELPGGGASLDGTGGMAWTPAGGLVTFRYPGGKQQIWMENGDGGNAHMLPVAGLPDSIASPLAAPTGQIVFADYNEGTIWRMNSDGSGLTELVQPPAGGAAQLCDLAAGKEVIYFLVDKQANQTLWGIPLQGGTPRQLWTDFVYAGYIPASPDGTRVFAMAKVAGNAQEPVIVRIDGGQPQVTRVAFDPKTMLSPYAWTPDGRALTYINRQGTTDNIWAFPLNGGKPYAITHFSDLSIAAYAFSHDGRLAISRGSPNSDAVLATGLGGSRDH